MLLGMDAVAAGRRVEVSRLATVVIPTALTAAAFVGLSRLGAVGDLPLWLPISLLGLTAISGELSFRHLGTTTSSKHLHRAVALQIFGVAAIVYTIGWGPMLSIGYVLILSHALELVGSRAWRPTLLWSSVAMLCGQVAIACNVVPTYVAVPYVHGLAVLGLLGSAIVMRLLGTKTADNEAAMSLLSATLESTADGILVLDTKGLITLWNEQFAAMWDVSSDVLLSEKRGGDLAFLVERLARPNVFVAKAREFVTDPASETEDILEFKDGRVLECRTRPQRVEGTIAGRVWSFKDVTERVELVRQLSHQAFHDSLTGLANRALLRDRLEHALARSRRSAATVAVMFCDVDRFKVVNDTLGHECGDALLVEIARRLEANIREGDTAARLGGDEFAIVMEEVRDDDTANLAARLLVAIREPFTVKGHDVFVRASIGIADTRDEPLDADELLCRADIAMYAAKNRGKDRYEAFHPTMQVELTTAHELYGDLRQAMQRGEISLHYQPLVELATNKITSFEALARWQHPTRGLVVPDVFIPLAEDTGLIVELGRFVLREACRQLQQWQQSWNRTDLTVSVNVSSHQLHDDTFIDDVRAILTETDLPAHGLILELTETALLSDSTEVHDRLNTLKRLGIRIAIDDFGTGYSSLAYLRSFPIDSLKIDRAFIHELTDMTSDQGHRMVRSIIDIGHNLHLNVIAEGVEQPEQLAVLLDAGCNSAQGYLFAKPLPADAIPQLIANLEAEATQAAGNEIS